MHPQSDQALQTRLIDYIQLSPVQRYSKYKQFPWAPIMLLCLVFTTTLMVQSLVLGPKVQERNIHIFFNYHILQHENFDIYEGDDIATISTQEYKDFVGMTQFFNRTLKIVGNMNDYNFYEANQTEINHGRHTINKYLVSGLPEKKDMTLHEIIQSGQFGMGLKEYLKGAEKLEMIFRISNMTLNVKNVELILNIEIFKKFQMKVTLKTRCYNLTFTKQDRDEKIEPQPILEPNQTNNLKVRKVPSHHHQRFAPYNIAYVFRLALILLSFYEGYRRIFIYRQHPFAINGISEGQVWQKLPFLKQCKLMGWWNILTIVTNVIGLVGNGAAVFTAWIQLVRYIEYTENPYIITFLFKNIFKLMLTVIFTSFFVITGFVLFSMVTFSGIDKFQTPQFAYFNYAFNNFQYGIYQNFVAIKMYGGFYQLLYFIFCFYMVWCTNNIVPSIICNTVINKNRLKYLNKFFKQIRIPCPVCKHITNQQAEKAVKKTYGMLSMFAGHDKESQIQMKIQSPKILPFISPKLLPASKTNLRQQQLTANKPKRTKFQIKQELNVKLDINSVQLFRQKIELLRKKIDQSLLQLDIFGGRGHNQQIKTKLLQSVDKVAVFRGKVQRKIKQYNDKLEIKKVIESSRRRSATGDGRERSS